MPQKLYLDSSALVKLVVDEAESEALRNRLELDVVPTSSVVSAVEVPRAPAGEAWHSDRSSSRRS